MDQMDLSQRVEQIERKLRESELRFRLLAENTTDVISRHTPQGHYLYTSPACKSLLGYTPDELIDKPIYRYLHHDDIAKVRKAFNRKLNQTNNKPVLYRVRRKDTEFRWFESNLRVIINEETRAISEVQLASRDVTDRVLDKKARLRGQQLARVYRLSSMEEMASGIAHEISQPLAAIVNYTRGCVRYLQNGVSNSDEIKDAMQKAVIQAERAGEIVQRLKNFFCKGQLIKTACKMNNVLRETITLMKNELIHARTKIELELDKEVPLIFIDKMQVQQVLLNLLQNAIESMQQSHTKEKRIFVQAKRCDQNKLEITLRDTGPGFSKDVMHKVFMPFFTTKAHGRGMGLAICRSIIEAHGGQFTIHPNHQNSSWIKFSLPIATE